MGEGALSAAPEALLARLEALRVQVVVEGDDLRLRGDGPKPSPAFLEELRREKPQLLAHLRAGATTGEGWPPESADCMRRFGSPQARLYPFIGRRVATPDGPGLLLQVLNQVCAVRLDRTPERVRFLGWEPLRPPR